MLSSGALTYCTQAKKQLNLLADYNILPPVHGLMKVKTPSEQVAPTCQTILGANGSCGFQGPVHGKVKLFLDWHPLPTVPADPEVSQPFLRRDRQLPTLQCARRFLYCLWLVFMILRVISSLIDSKFSCCLVMFSLLRKAEQRFPRSCRKFFPQCIFTCLDLPCYPLWAAVTAFFSQCMGDTCTHFHRRFVQLLGATHQECLGMLYLAHTVPQGASSSRVT